LTFAHSEVLGDLLTNQRIRPVFSHFWFFVFFISGFEIMLPDSVYVNCQLFMSPPPTRSEVVGQVNPRIVFHFPVRKGKRKKNIKEEGLEEEREE